MLIVSIVEKSNRRYLHYFFTRLSPGIQLNIDKELESDDFHDYVYDEISKIKNFSETSQ